MSDPMAEIRASFFIECEELLESLQDALQLMDDGDTSSDTINVVFRAVHSIKGGAGAFGLDALVSFAHQYETAMDEVRGGRLVPDAEAIRLFFTCGDILADLVRVSRDGETLPDEVTAPILKALEELIGEQEAEEEVDFTPATLSLDLDFGAPVAEDAPPQDGAKFVTFAPEDDLYSSGNEPLYLLRALRDLGDISVTCKTAGIPTLESFNIDNAALIWDIEVVTEEEPSAISEVFEFVDGLCKLDIHETRPAPSSEVIAGEDVEPAAPAAEEPPAPEPVSQTPTPPVVQKVEKPAETPTEKPIEKPQATQPRATVRVDLERIDRLVNLVGELVINQAMLSQSVAEAGLPPNSPVASGLEEFMQLTRDIQESVMMIRAQPIKSLFQRMGRIVRESSAAVGKDVRLHTEGENTEVDKTVIERLADPLTHMIRNAVDHGLETTEGRAKAGKDSVGHVHLTAQHRSGRIVIEISDDGGGINRERVKEKAIENGLIAPDAQLSESEIDNLLFMPGFSTAAEVSNLSGRGVGMDVVRSAIQALGGRITITSEAGKGTTFSISLPLTLAVLDGMVVKVADQTLVVPLNAILETLSLSEGDLKSIGPETQVLQIRGGFVPLIDLGAELGYRTTQDTYDGGIVLLIGQEDGNRAAMAVDAIEDQRQVVIKGLEGSYGRVPGIAAATILGDGQIALILDPTDLISTASGRTKKRNSDMALAG